MFIVSIWLDDIQSWPNDGFCWSTTIRGQHKPVLGQRLAFGVHTYSIDDVIEQQTTDVCVYTCTQCLTASQSDVHISVRLVHPFIPRW